MSRPIIEVSGLSKRYQLGAIGATSLREEVSRIVDRFRGVPHPDAQEFWALRDVSFEIKAGEVVGVIGRNGAGKSTLLKILSRITEPTTGKAVLRGRVASLLEVGTGFHPELTGRENIFLNGAILGMTRAEVRRKFDEIVAFAEVDQFIDTPVKRYSSGMYVRLAFAVAAHLEPEILIVDEVLAVGDAAFQKKCLGKMNAVAEAEGRTVFFVSHNMSAVQSLCTTSLLFEHGRLVATGDPGAMTKRFLHALSGDVGSLSWPTPDKAPGNEHVRFREISLRVSGDRTVIDVHTPVDIVVRYWNNLPGGVQNVSLMLNTATGVCVLNTYSRPRPEPAGIVTVVCRIPGDLLNDETYQLEIMIVKDGSSALFHLRDSLSFTVHEGRREGAWHGKHAGVIRPQIAWENEPAN